MVINKIKEYPKWALLFVVLMIIWIIASTMGLWKAGSGLQGELERGDGKTLVVLLHGLAGNSKKMNAIKNEIRRKPEYIKADFYQPQYMANPLSNTNPSEIAGLLELKIHQFHISFGYTNIILIGHSMGDLLCRQAYLKAADRENPVTWSNSVSRIISLAGINRGWSADSEVERPNRIKRLLWHIGDIVSHFTLSGEMAEQLRKGSPFITNLRIQWMRFIKKRQDEKKSIPLLIQIVGENDDVISREDSLDLSVSKQFHSFLVAGAGHGNVVNFNSPIFGNELKQIFSLALKQKYFTGQEHGYIHNECGRSDQICRKTHIDPSITEVIFVRHGIRDLGDWGIRFKKRYRELNRNRSNVYIDPSSYTRMPLAPFLLFNSREQRVNEFMDDYTQLVARFPNAEKFHFVGHSNGTYLLARALKKYKQLQINQVIFAGTVTPRKYPWRELMDETKQVGEVLNFVGKDDLVVGIFPRLFELIHELTGLQGANFNQLGSAGYSGYHYNGQGMYRIDGLGGHGWAVSKHPQFDTMIKFLNQGGSTLEIPDAPERPGSIELISNLCWLVWLTLIGIIFGVGWYLFKRIKCWADDRPEAKLIERFSPELVSLAYLAFISGILFSI